VFINKNGLPTYEAKDVGLSIKKWDDYHFDASIIITANDIIDYMKVVIKSISLFAPELAERTRHLTHGNVKLAGGVKMSSRLGNSVKAVDVLNVTKQEQITQNGDAKPEVVLGAIKYAFLKTNVGPDVIYDPSTSVSLVGNSGPYVQYAAVRVNKILRDNQATRHSEQSEESSGMNPDSSESKILQNGNAEYDFTDEKLLILKLLEYPVVMREAAKQLEPHRIANYAYELAKELNKYYETTPIATANVPDEIKQLRLEFLEKISKIFTHALGILGINIPEKM
jgi:arginyl-tRNA synthetase